MKKIILFIFVLFVLYNLFLFLNKAKFEYFLSKLWILDYFKNYNEFVISSKKRLDEFVLWVDVWKITQDAVDKAGVIKENANNTIKEVQSKLDFIRDKSDETLDTITGTVNSLNNTLNEVKNITESLSWTLNN